MTTNVSDPGPDRPSGRDLLQVASETWLRRAQVKVGGVEERLQFDLTKDDFPDALVPFHQHPAYAGLSPEQRGRIRTCGWIAYNAKTVVIETDIVTPVCTACLRGDLPGVDDRWTARVISETLVDEAYHTYLAVVVTDLSKQRRGLDPPLREFALTRNLKRRVEACSTPRARALAHLSVATVSELLISDYLSQLSSDASIQPIHSQSVASHLRDELAHSTVFAEVAKRVSRHLTDDELDSFCASLADAALWFSDPEREVWAGILDYLGVAERQELLDHVTELAAVRTLRPGNYKKLVQFANASGLMERPAAREAFERVGLVAARDTMAVSRSNPNAPLVHAVTDAKAPRVSLSLNRAWTRLPSYTSGISEEAVRRKFKLDQIVKLGSNENPLGPGRAAIEAMLLAAPGSGRYPDAYELEAALCARLRISPSRLTLTNGSSEAIDLLARAFLHPGVDAVIAAPSFILYPIVVAATGATLRAVPTRSDWRVDLDAIADAVTPSTRLVLLGNPNNPTGLWHDEREIVRLLESLPSDVVLVLDEAYFEYVSEPGYPNGIELQERFPNLVVTRTFSKVHGLAGMRVGYAVSHPSISDCLQRARPPFNVNSLALAAARAALDDEQHVQTSIQLNRSNRARLDAALASRCIQVVPSVANFVAARFGSDARSICDRLLQSGVVLRPIGNMDGFVRISVGTEAEIDVLLAALDTALHASRATESNLRAGSAP